MKSFVLTREKLLSAEKGRMFKKTAHLRVALGFPNTYEVGMSNLGFETVYRLLNQMDQVACERFFLFDFPPYRGARTLESNRNIKHFDLISFSVPFELDYPNILQLLKLSEIPLLSSHRKENAPLIIAGGVASTLNPEVLAPFFDCLFIGEAEEMLVEFMELHLSFHHRRVPKEKVLLELSKLKGVYVPRFYEFRYHGDGSVKRMTVQKGVPEKIVSRRVSLKNLETFSPITSPYAHFKNSFLVEVGRGCARGCRFCAAGFAYRPCRFYEGESVLSQVEKHAGDSKHVGLIGSLISDHPELENICQALHSKGYEIGTSSLRVDSISESLLKILVDSGMKTLTIAPEAGTDRMWKVINKKIDREAVLKSAELASGTAIPTLKLYFIVGLPFEREEDVDGIVDLVREVHRIFIKEHKPDKTRGKKRSVLRRLRISVNPFIPKPHTPFQWCGMDQESELKRKLRKIADRLKALRGVHVEKKSVRQAILQGLFSLGNRDIGRGLYYAVEEDLNYRQAWKKAGVGPERIVFRPRELASVLPWNIIDVRLSKSRLVKELKEAQRAAAERR
ncbi:MAG: radical SAM protein [Candidatus Zixiibacteriota bacterium]|nr:MAG: radical SAM protein [candidate division Zixibacteria bacterium]